MIDPSRTDYLETYTGRKVFPTDYGPDDVCMIDVAHHLSMKCRYGGATSPFYSVGEHCGVLAQHHINENPGDWEGALNVLLHDAGEYITPDIQRPIKHLAPKLVEVERHVGRTVRLACGLQGDEPAFVKTIDKRITQDERAHFMSDSGNEWLLKDGQRPLGVVLRGLEPPTAEQMFKTQFAYYMWRHSGRLVYANRHINMPEGPSLLKSMSCDFDSVEKPGMDWIEVDTIGGVALFWQRGDGGMMERDRRAGRFPLPRTRWVRGKFDMRVMA